MSGSEQVSADVAVNGQASQNGSPSEPGGRFVKPQEGHALRYETKVDLSEQNTSQAQVVMLAGWDKKVLEVGPASGYMTKALNERGCRVTGIELDPAAAKIGAQFCERMIVGDIERLDLPALFGEEKFDVVLFSDVLEHLIDPVAVLASVKAILTPGGYVCASIPNVTHGSIRLALLAGRFRYMEQGLLDRTHLRFFNRGGVAELFAAAGYAVREWNQTNVGVFASEMALREQDYPAALMRALETTPDHLVYQFVVRAEPIAEGEPIEVLSPESYEADVKKMFEPLWSMEMRTWELQQEIHRLRGLIELEVGDAVAERDILLSQLTAELAGARHAYEVLNNRLVYRLVQRAEAALDRQAPWGSRRRKLLLMPGYALRIVLDNGPSGLARKLFKVWEWAPKLLQKSVQPLALPQGISYGDWERHHVLAPEMIRQMRLKIRQFVYQPKITIVVPVYNPEPEWLRDAIESVKGQVYPNWELCIVDDKSQRQDVLDLLKEYESSDPRIKVTFLKKNLGIAGASAAALETATGEFVGFLDHDDELKAHALYHVVKLLNDRRDLDYIYSDSDHRSEAGILGDPFRKPGWSPDLLKSCNYVTHFSVYRRSVLDSVGGMRPGFDGSQDWDLTLRVTEATERIAHIPVVLYTWRQVPGSAAHDDMSKPWAHDAARRALADSLARRGIDGSIEDGPYPGYYRVRYAITGEPKVSIIIPTRNRVDLLRTCIDSIRTLSTWQNYEIIIVDNNSDDPEALEYLETYGGRVVRHPGEFNFSRIVNAGAEQAEGEYILLLNNDTEVIAPDWIEAMLEHAQRPEVGVVGARLLFPDGKAQHEGVIVGPGDGLAGNVDFDNYFGLGRCVHNVSAVTGACMMSRTEVYKGLGGYDEELRVAYNDVDYCLRASEKGFLVVYTPYAELRHFEGATRGIGDEATAQKAHPIEDENTFRARWSGFSDPWDAPSQKSGLPPIPTI
jgi:O-antigen biosynthesis protein